MLIGSGLYQPPRKIEMKSWLMLIADDRTISNFLYVPNFSRWFWYIWKDGPWRGIPYINVWNNCSSARRMRFWSNSVDAAEAKKVEGTGFTALLIPSHLHSPVDWLVTIGCHLRLCLRSLWDLQWGLCQISPMDGYRCMVKFIVTSDVTFTRM